MAPGTSEEPSSFFGKVSKTGKEGKSTKESKEGKKAKDEGVSGAAGEGKNSILFRQMAADIAAVSANLQRLQSDVDTLKGLSEPLPFSDTERGIKTNHAIRTAPNTSGASAALLAILMDEPDVALVLAVPAENIDGTPFVCAPDQGALTGVDSAQVAKLGYAFSSVPKVALIRMLLENGEQTAAQLGEGAGLTTGSLYHHLRELVHAEVAHQSSRNRYALTDLGRRSVLVLLALQS